MKESHFGLYRLNDTYFLQILHSNKQLKGFIYESKTNSSGFCNIIHETDEFSDMSSLINFSSSYISSKHTKVDEKSGVWLNVDLPQRTCTLHDSNCRHIPISETPNKGLQRLLQHGGWFKFVDGDQAKLFANQHQSELFYTACSGCFSRLYYSRNYIVDKM